MHRKKCTPNYWERQFSGLLICSDHLELKADKCKQQCFCLHHCQQAENSVAYCKQFMAKGTCGCQRNSPPHHEVLWTEKATLHCQKHVNMAIGLFNWVDTIMSGFSEMFRKCLASTVWKWDPLSCRMAGSPSKAKHLILLISNMKSWLERLGITTGNWPGVTVCHSDEGMSWVMGFSMLYFVTVPWHCLQIPWCALLPRTVKHFTSEYGS